MMKPKEAAQGQTTRKLRARARRVLTKRVGLGPPDDGSPELHRLVQELQIHQIELEMQNEELSHAKSQVESVLAKYTHLYDSAPIGFFTVDERGVISEANLTGALLVGMDRAELHGKRFVGLVSPQSRAGFRAFLRQAFTSSLRQSCQVLLLRQAGAALWCNLDGAVSKLGLRGRGLCQLAIMDISARRQAEEANNRIEALRGTNLRLEEEIDHRKKIGAALTQSEQRTKELLVHATSLQRQLREVSHRNLIVQERREKRISQDLHSKIGQLLVGINLHLEVLTRTASMGPAGMKRVIAPIQRLVERTVRTVHQFARELRPTILDDMGLISALRAYVNDFPRRKALKISFDSSMVEVEMSNEKQTLLYRVAQESLENVTRHARATTVKIRISRDEHAVMMSISDNGRGFDTTHMDSMRSKSHLGLVAMRERIGILGGTFSIVSSPDSGTVVSVRMPILGLEPGRDRAGSFLPAV